MGSLLSWYTNNFQQKPASLELCMGLSQWPSLSSVVSDDVSFWQFSVHPPGVDTFLLLLIQWIFLCTLRWQGLLSFPSSLKVLLFRGKGLKWAFCGGCSPTMGLIFKWSFLCLLSLSQSCWWASHWYPLRKASEWVCELSLCLCFLEILYYLKLVFSNLCKIVSKFQVIILEKWKHVHTKTCKWMFAAVLFINK